MDGHQPDARLSAVLETYQLLIDRDVASPDAARRMVELNAEYLDAGMSPEDLVSAIRGSLNGVPFPEPPARARDHRRADHPPGLPASGARGGEEVSRVEEFRRRMLALRAEEQASRSAPAGAAAASPPAEGIDRFEAFRRRVVAEREARRLP